jgi:hypothetical protein
MGERLCKCGSGESPWWLKDCQGIPCQLVCSKCEKEAMKRYNPWVFEGYDQSFLDEHSGESIEPDVEIEPSWSELHAKYGGGSND